MIEWMCFCSAHREHADCGRDDSFKCSCRRWTEEQNDKLWGKGNWVRCAVCPVDSLGNLVYHHKDHHL